MSQTTLLIIRRFRCLRAQSAHKLTHKIAACEEIGEDAENNPRAGDTKKQNNKFYPNDQFCDCQHALKPYNSTHVYSQQISKSDSSSGTFHPLPNPKCCHTCGLHVVPKRYRHLYKDVSNKNRNGSIRSMQNLSNDTLRNGQNIKENIKMKVRKEGTLYKLITRHKKGKGSTNRSSLALGFSGI